MTDNRAEPDEIPSDPDVDRLLEELEELESRVDDPEERKHVRRSIDVARAIPGSAFVNERIDKYTTRDVAQGLVGSIVFALPLLVEDGVFEIAEFLVGTFVAGIPVYFVANVAFVVGMTVGLLYWADFRDVKVSRPIFGVVPRRLVGVLAVSFLTSAGLLIMWGRLFAGNPSTPAVIGRITVVWAVASLGAGLGDILPGQSTGHDLTLENLDDLIGSE